MIKILECCRDLSGMALYTQALGLISGTTLPLSVVSSTAYVAQMALGHCCGGPGGLLGWGREQLILSQIIVTSLNL